jgi:hypothetical protein
MQANRRGKATCTMIPIYLNRCIAIVYKFQTYANVFWFEIVGYCMYHVKFNDLVDRWTRLVPI